MDQFVRASCAIAQSRSVRAQFPQFPHRFTTTCPDASHDHLHGPLTGVEMMPNRTSQTLALVLGLTLLPPASALASTVHPSFDLDAPASGPFPSDRFTVADRRQLTGLRVQLPKPDCTERLSDCEDLRVVNTLDGFNVQPRLSIPFDGAVDVRSVGSDTVFLLRLRCAGPPHLSASAGDRRHRLRCARADHRTMQHTRIGINQIVWDTFTHTLHVESDALLEQHTQYALIVTTGVRDWSGRRIRPAEAFRRFRQTVRHPYREALLDAIHAARRLGVREDEIAVASVFTTRSVTAVLEQIRDQIKAATPAPAEFNLAPDGGQSVFWLSDMTDVIVTQQTGTAPSFAQTRLTLAGLNSIPGAVGQVAFGKFVSADYQVHPGEVIPFTATRTGVPAVQGANDLYFNLVLPAGTPPPGGWPVAISGHGGGGSKEGFSLGTVSHVSAALAAQGIASIHANFVGHGFGERSTLTVNRASGGPVTFSSGGRGHDQDGDGNITAAEGRAAALPWTIVQESDGMRQSIADLMQLVRLIQLGIDVDEDATPDLDGSRIYFFGQSFGGFIGSVFMAVEPDVRTGVITSAGGPWTARVLSPTGNRASYGQMLTRRTPSLITSPGVTHIDGVPVPASPLFNENMPLRDGAPLLVRLADGTSDSIQGAVVNTVPGSTDIQEVLERFEWVQQSANPVAYARYLREAPLPGVPAKTMLLQFARGDQTIPNPLMTALLSAGNLADRAMLYRHDLAWIEDPLLPKDPHGFAYVFGEISRIVQEQIATFFASDGATVIQPQPSRFFEVPPEGPLPEDLSFIP